MRILSVLAATLLAAGLLAGLGCGTAPEPPRQVILLLLDAARADRFSSYGYTRLTTPEMDRLAHGGVVFHQHYAQGTGTRVSVPALLFSRYYSVPIFPNDPQVPYASPQTLFRRPDDEQISFVKAFSEAGFLTAAISAHLWTGKDTPFAAEFSEMHDLTERLSDGRHPYPQASKVIDFTLDWIEEHREEDFFLYVHLMDTHYPHFFEEDAQEFFGATSHDTAKFQDGGLPKVAPFRLTEDDLRYLDALYDGSLRYADRHIGRLLDFLAKEKLLETMTVALTSDHGEHLLDAPGGRPRPGVNVFSHGGAWLEPVARIPLILHSPDRLAPGLFRNLSEGVDVGPTLLGLAGAPIPAGKSFDGVDLNRVLAGEIPAKEQATMRRAIRTEKYKLIFENGDPLLLGKKPPDAEALRGQLYDLESDPGETKNIFAQNNDVVEDLVVLYRATMQAGYVRAEAALSHEQPRAAFAVSSRYFLTAHEIPQLRGMTAPRGWSRVISEPHSVLVAQKADRDLDVHFKIPDGRYRFFAGLMGRAKITVDGVEKDLVSPRGMAPYGEIEVRDETFRATIRPPRDELLRILYFGFIPPGATLDGPASEERTRRLRALGYIQ